MPFHVKKLIHAIGHVVLHVIQPIPPNQDKSETIKYQVVIYLSLLIVFVCCFSHGVITIFAVLSLTLFAILIIFYLIVQNPKIRTFIVSLLRRNRRL